MIGKDKSYKRLFHGGDDPLDPQGYAHRAEASDFPGETFLVLKEIRQFGEYRTRRLILEAWERLEKGGILECQASS